jgi:hypothetical protein
MSRSSSNQQTIEFQLELMMVHLEQMNKRLDMLEKTCMSLIEKKSAPAVVCPYHTMSVSHHLDKRIDQDIMKEKQESQKIKINKSVKDSYSTMMQRKAAV